jgi:hypothetical protein
MPAPRIGRMVPQREDRRRQQDDAAGIAADQQQEDRGHWRYRGDEQEKPRMQRDEGAKGVEDEKWAVGVVP